MPLPSINSCLAQIKLFSPPKITTSANPNVFISGVKFHYFSLLPITFRCFALLPNAFSLLCTTVHYLAHCFPALVKIKRQKSKLSKCHYFSPLFHLLCRGPPQVEHPSPRFLRDGRSQIVGDHGEDFCSSHTARRSPHMLHSAVAKTHGDRHRKMLR